jgi:GGDEF domain-containing protein
VLLVDADEETGARLSRRIAEALETHAEVEGHPVAAALGTATSPPIATVREAIDAADRAMYARKGRERRNLFPVPGPIVGAPAVTGAPTQAVGSSAATGSYTYP